MIAPPPPTCSVVIATLDRPESLAFVIHCLREQQSPPLELIVAAAGNTEGVSKLVSGIALPFPTHVIACEEKSSARQRNRAADTAKGDVIAFLDDDIEFGPDLFAQALSNFATPTIGAVSPRIANSERTRPGWLTRRYYRIQAGYSHPDFGARLFGVGINCAPVFGDDKVEKIAADWLPSTCLFIRADLFRRHRFPNFNGYSFAEDVHMTARAGREAALYFLREPSLQHHSLTSEFKTNRTALTAGKLHNMAVVAREVQGLTGWSLWWRWQLHRLFMLVVLLARRPHGWRDELRGVAAAHR